MICISSNPNQDVLEKSLKELKVAWDKQWRRNDILESKATSIIQVAGIVTALIFGFVTFSQSTGNKLSFIPLTQGIIIASIFFSLGSIVLSILTIRTKTFFLYKEFPQKHRFHN